MMNKKCVSIKGREHQDLERGCSSLSHLPFLLWKAEAVVALFIFFVKITYETSCTLFHRLNTWSPVFQEIYPPKLHQFAYVTDGACTEDEIVSMELIIMKVVFKSGIRF